MEDFGVPAEWHFFATSHGKTAADDIEVPCTQGKLQSLYKNRILNLQQLYELVMEVKIHMDP